MKERIPNVQNIMMGMVIDDFKDKFKLEESFSLKIAKIADIRNILVKLKAQVPVPKSPGNIRLKGRYKVKINKKFNKLVKDKTKIIPIAINPKITSNILFKTITSIETRTKKSRTIDKTAYKKQLFVLF